MRRVALATCAAFAGLDDEDRLVIPELNDLGAVAVGAVWDDPAIVWSDFDAVVIRETWDYVDRRDAFVSWLRVVDAQTLLLNPAHVLEWNTDKRYMRDLAVAGVPTTPTTFLEPDVPDHSWAPVADFSDFVVKPAVSAGSRDTCRYSSAGPRDAAQAHIDRLLAQGRTVMIQPYVESVDEHGETAALFLGGEFSHGIRKGPMLERGVEAELVSALFLRENVSPQIPSPKQLEVARQALAAVPGGPERLLYARVDLVASPEGSPQVLELELTEPSLFLSRAPGAARRLAEAIVARLG